MEELIFTVGFLGVCYVTGRIAESRHYKSIRKREQSASLIPVLNVGKKPTSLKFSSGTLVSANVVIGADYFKAFLGGLISIFGGRVSSLESVLDRGRREALLRLQEEAPWADYIVNVRYETAFLNGQTKKSWAPMVQVLAYGTAVKLCSSTQQE